MGEHQSGLSVRQAGRRGGLALLQRRGRQFFREIGCKGQAALRTKYPGMAREWGKRKRGSNSRGTQSWRIPPV